MYGFISVQDATMVLQAAVLQPITGVFYKLKPQLLCWAASKLGLENVYLIPAGVQAVVNARGSLTATIDKL